MEPATVWGASVTMPQFSMISVRDVGRTGGNRNKTDSSFWVSEPRNGNQVRNISNCQHASCAQLGKAITETWSGSQYLGRCRRKFAPRWRTWPNKFLTRPTLLHDELRTLNPTNTRTSATVS